MLEQTLFFVKIGTEGSPSSIAASSDTLCFTNIFPSYNKHVEKKDVMQGLRTIMEGGGRSKNFLALYVMI